ncbi:hypothetical protein FA13DRAFT_1731842, partial [Coprinellus micaceus]
MSTPLAPLLAPSQLLTCPSYAPKSRPCIPKGVGLIEMLSRTGEGMTHQLCGDVGRVQHC